MYRYRKVRDHVDIAGELDKVVCLLQFAKNETDSATDNCSAHTDKATHEHKDAHDAHLTEAHAAENADFFGLVDDDHDKANHRRHDELFVVHPLEERDVFRLPVHRVIRIT